MSTLQTKINMAGITLTNAELIAIARAEALLRDEISPMAEIDAELDRRLEENYQREKQSKAEPDTTCGGLLKNI